eukprot:scaffold198125_cov31-Tisochrysis_lutea.AAC.3
MTVSALNEAIPLLREGAKRRLHLLDGVVEPLLVGRIHADLFAHGVEFSLDVIGAVGSHALPLHGDG